MSTFEGKYGPLVEVTSPSWDDLDDEAYEEISSRYSNDPVFCNEIGPSIELFGDHGENEYLFGLQIDVDLGSFGTIRGIVKESYDNYDLGVEWRCGPSTTKIHPSRPRSIVIRSYYGAW